MKHDRFETIKSLHGTKRLEYIWDYYRYRIAAAIVVVIIAVVAANMLIEGQRHYRLDIFAVLNTEDDCSSWFKDFEKSLTSDGTGGRIQVNYDQPFDYDNRYYYVQELEVMTTVSSYRIDAAICNEDMYSYLLAINACARMDEVLDSQTFKKLTGNGSLKEDLAGLQADENGNINTADGIPGYYGIDISDTAFGQAYNQPADGSTPEPLYAVIISNTDNMSDCIKLIECVIGDGSL